MRKELLRKIDSIDWLKGITREHYLMSILAFTRSYWGFKKLKVKSPRYSQIAIMERGLWTIYRPKKYFEELLASLKNQLSKAPSQVTNNLKKLENLNLEVATFCQRNLKDLKLPWEIFLQGFKKLTEKYCMFYLYNAFLADSLEKFKKSSRFLKKIVRLRNEPGYLKLENFFKEFTEYVGLDKKLAKFYSFDDLRYFLEEGKSPKINQRRRKILVFGEHQRVHLFTKKGDILKIQKILNKRRQTEIKSGEEIKGLSAYRGKTRGRVIVIKTLTRHKKIKKGDILVIPMTRPDIAPYLKHIKAIVTDEGGFLCHAAIIARELKKPCIIGTKIATKVLKDGDIVEVDANKGVVKILKKAK